MIEQLVADLPEVYQPIYGHPELSEQISRSCTDRLQHITRTHDALQNLLGRPLKVLDLGCAQGYFSLNLAERGAIVTGVDFLDKNVAVCAALAKEHPSLQIQFKVARIEEVIADLGLDQYDLVLGLSVFHHIAHEQGAPTVKALITQAAAQSGVLLLEMALREEPLYWAAAQPNDPREWLEYLPFVHELARHGTHLAPIARPLFVASNRYWVLGEHAARFENWSSDPHALAQGTHEGSRRYFFSHTAVLKTYRFDHQRGAHNRTEFAREIAFLQQPPAEYEAPKLIASDANDAGAWLVVERLPGQPLLNLLHEAVMVDHRAILLDVLQQLEILEAAGLYHNDVRTWNVLVSDVGRAHLIDYGSISSKAEDCVWPRNLYLAFFIFVKEVATGVVDNPDPMRAVSISPYGLPQPYRAWATSLWRRPLAQWSFALMHEALKTTPVDASDDHLDQPLEAWMKATEEAIQTQKVFTSHLRHQAAADKHEYTERLAAIAHRSEGEIKLLSETLNQFGQTVVERLTLAESLEKQLAWAHEQCTQADRRYQALETRWYNTGQRLAVVEAQLEWQRQRTEVAEIQLEAQRQRADAAELRAQEQRQRAEAAEAQSQEQRQLAEAAEAQSQEQRQRAEAAEAQSQEQCQRAEAQIEIQRQLREAHEAQVQGLQQRVDELGGGCHHWWLQAQQLEAERNALKSSWSWRLTGPLRLVGGMAMRPVASARKAANWIIYRTIELAQKPLARLMQKVLQRPALTARINRWLMQYPPLYQHLVSVAQRQGVFNVSPMAVPVQKTGAAAQLGNVVTVQPTAAEDLSLLTPQARQIYAQLKVAIEKQKGPQ